ncbi:MAG TPA: hypothetical protein VLE51_00690 [Candidatus Saccharimonadales bacterium]|nr:hypothetical protein [Candidatus Saccharimonadales bacterium]
MRKVALGIAGTALVFFLFATAIDVGVIRIVGSPDPIKKILSDSGIYNSVVPSSLDNAKQISGSSQDVPLTDPIARSAAESTFSPQFIKTSTDSVVDSIYRWLNGKSALPDFKIDLTPKKSEFINKVAVGVQQKAASLSRCTTLPSTTSFDVFNASCLPPGVTPAQAAETVRSDLSNGQGFLDSPVITADSVKTTEICPTGLEGCPSPPVHNNFFSKNNNLPQYFQRLKVTPLIFVLITILLLLGIIFLSNSRLKGIRHVGFVLIGTGIFVILFALAVNAAVNNKVLPKISLTNTVLQDDVRKLVHDTVHRADNTFLALGSGYAILGALGVGGFYLRRHHQPSAETMEKDIHTDDSTPQAEPKPPKPKSKRPAVKKIKVN